MDGEVLRGGSRDDEDKGTTRLFVRKGESRRERREGWRKGRGLARPHAVNTPQWRRNVTGFSSGTFAPHPGLPPRLLLALFPHPPSHPPGVLAEFSRENAAESLTPVRYRV